MRSGWVYVFSNPGLSALKLGMTTRPLYFRQAELQREYGTAYPFEIASRHAVDDPAAVEALAHRILDRYRLPRSELFACDLRTCQAAIHQAARAVVQRPWKLRLWYWLTLRGPKRPTGRYRSQRGDPAAFWLLLGAVAVVAAVVTFQPAIPAWLPSSILRAAYLAERLHR